jgi:hypothetical protein
MMMVGSSEAVGGCDGADELEERFREREWRCFGGDGLVVMMNGSSSGEKLVMSDSTWNPNGEATFRPPSLSTERS